MSGILAAEAVLRARENPTTSAEEIYMRTYDRAFRREQRLALLVSLLCCRKGKRTWRVFQNNPELSEGFMALMAHTAGYGDLLRKGMLTWPAALLQGILTKDAE